MKTGLYLDTRFKARKDASLDDGDKNISYPVKISISESSRSAYIPTGISVRRGSWSATEELVTEGAGKTGINIKLAEKKLAVDKTLEELRLEGALHGLSIVDIKNAVVERIRQKEERESLHERTVASCFEAYISGIKRTGTKSVYKATVRRLFSCTELFLPTRTTFQDITPRWLSDFDRWLALTAPSANARGIHLRNIRTVFNFALENGYTEAPYPFKRFRIHTAPTADRSLSPEEFRAFINAPCSESQRNYRDIFLIGFLCCGINLEDLLAVKELKVGRIVTSRIKTGQPLDIPVPPEAMELIEKHRGKKQLLDVYDRCSSYHSYLHRLNKALKTIGMSYNEHTKRWEGKPLQPEISYYWGRYTWATTAAMLDIPERTIGAALGHSTAKSVTSIYTRVDMRKKIDEASRRVINEIFKK